MKHAIALSFCVLLVALTPWARAADSKPDDEGFIKDWLLLAPIPLGDGISGADEIDKKQIADEAGLKPKAGDKQKVLDKEVEWKAISAKAFDIDINDQLKGSHEDVLGYLVA